MYRKLLSDAFEAQRRDIEIETPPEYRLAGVEFLNASAFRYDGELPKGIRGLERYPGSIMGPGEPYLVFEGLLDTDAMQKAIIEVFGNRVSIERHDRTGTYGVRRTRWWLNWLTVKPLIFQFKEKDIIDGNGWLEYHTDTSVNEFAAQTPKVVEVVARYLERKNPTSQKDQLEQSA